MNKSLLTPEIQDYIHKNLKQDVVKLILQGSPFKTVSIKAIAEQIEGKRKIEKKLPTWFNTRNLLYPPLLNLSQTSSEITARYKASLVSGKSLIDITGGLGIDSYYFAQTFKKVIHCEKNEDLSAIARHNFKQLQPANPIQTICEDSLVYLQKYPDKVDWIYADPGRRSSTGQKIFRLEDSLPNILKHLDLLFEKAHGVLLKTSPLLDLSLGLEQLKTVSAIHVVAIKNEVKELLWILQPNQNRPLKIQTVNFGSYKNEYFNAIWGAEKNNTPSFSLPLDYLYEPNSALLKAGLFNTVATAYPVNKLAQNTHLYTSQEVIDFPGRRFQILESLPFHKKNIKKMRLQKAHITTRNFPLSVREIRKRYKIAEGGQEYLFFTTTFTGEKTILKCQKITGKE